MGSRLGAVVVLACLVTTCLFPGGTRATSPVVVDQLYLDSAPGDTLDHGRIRSIRSPDEGTIFGGPSAANPVAGAGADFTVWPTDTTEDGTNWSLGFEAPPDQLLAPGHYEADDDPYLSTGKAYFRITGNTSACTSTAASFDILEASFRNDGTPTAFAARFEQWCGTGPMRGEIRFHSSIPLVARDITPVSLSYPTTDVGATSDPETLTINNTGTADLVIAAGLSISQQFRVTSDGCSGSTVAVGASCPIQVVFEPDVGGLTIGFVTFSDNSIGASRSVRVDGSGMATTTTTLTSSVNPNIYPTKPTTLTAVVDPTPDFGSISFYVDGNLTATKSLTNGHATLAYDAPRGPHTIVARFLGRPYWRASESPPLIQQSKFVPDIALWASPIAAPDLHPVALGAELRPPVGVDGGTLTLVDETTGKTIGTTGASGVIFDCLERPAAGTHHLKATFSGYADALATSVTIDVTIGTVTVTYGPALSLDVTTGSVWCADVRDPNGSVNVTNPSLTLTAQAVGPLRFANVRLSNTDATDANGLLAKGKTFAYGSPISWSLIDPGVGGVDADGQILVWYQLQDTAGSWTPLLLATFWLDRAAPVGTLIIDSGLATTATTSATLSVPASDATTGVSAVALSNDGNTWTTRTYTATQAWTLPATNGTRTVYAKWRDAAGNWSAAKSDTIVLDSMAPTGSVSINAGAGYTRSTAATVSVNAADSLTGVSQVALSNDGVTWTTRTFAATQAWTLPATNGTRTVRAKWRDGAGNWSAAKSDTIVLDTVVPTVTGPTNAFVSGSIVNSGLTSTKLSWSGADTTSGIGRYELAQSTDGGAYATVSTTLTLATTNRSLASGHTYRFRVRAVDRAGNTGAWTYGTTFRVSSYQETSTAIHYHGTWTRPASSNYWGGYDRYTTGTGAYATFTFTGRSFAWIGSRSTTRGSARVYVNGSLVATVSLYATTATNRQILWATAWSTAASRTITIKCVGTTGHSRIDVDALVTGS